MPINRFNYVYDLTIENAQDAYLYDFERLGCSRLLSDEWNMLLDRKIHCFVVN